MPCGYLKHNKLEAELQQYLHVPNVTLFSNGHLALDYPKMVSLLVEVAKNQQEQIEELLKLIGE